MQTARTTKNRGWWLLIGLLLILFYLAFAFYDGPHRYNDSGGYMAMDVSREPMYPLFLWAVRLVFGGLGEAGWLQAAVVIQSLIVALSALFFVRTLSESFSLSRLSDLALSFFAAAPSLMCRFVANRRMMYSNSVLSEALAIPLFLVFMTWLLRAAYVGGRRSFSHAAFWGFVLISVRKQMLITLPLLVLTALWRGIKERRVFARLLSAALLSAAVLLANNLLDRSYNYLVRGEFLRHTGDMRFVTTMLLYNAEPGDEQQIGDAELRALYLRIVEKADRQQNLHSYAPRDWFGRAQYFTNNYDHIQFDCLRDVSREYVRAKTGGDELAETRELDRINNALNAALLPVGKGRLLRTACDSFAVGLVTTVLSMNRHFVLPAAALYAVYLALTAWCIAKKRERAALFALLTLAAIGANLALVSLTIFCQARYTIYNMTLFYAALFLLARELLPAGWKRAL